MNPQLLQFIHDDLVYQQVTLVHIPQVNNYRTLQLAVFMKELLTESTVILKWTQDNFANNLKKRLFNRSANPDVFTTFDTVPDSFANFFYQYLVPRVFNTKIAGTIIPIINPKIKFQIKISAPTELPRANMTSEEQREYSSNFAPLIELIAIAEVKQEYPGKDFSHLVFAAEYFLDTRDIQALPLGAHANLKIALDAKYHKMAEKLYNHNASFRNLKNDIELYINKGMTPKQALANLSLRLNLSAAHISGNVQRSTAEAQNVLQWFQPYYHHLPEEIHKELSILSTDSGHTLSMIFTKIEEEECARKIHDLLEDYLKKNKKNWALNARPHMSKEQVQELLRKYQYKENEPELDSQYDMSNVVDLPRRLISTVLVPENFESKNDVCEAIINFNHLFFTMILPNIPHTPELIHYLLELSSENYLTSEQKGLLAKTLIQTAIAIYSHHELMISIFESKDCELITECLNQLTRDKTINLIARNPKLLELAAPMAPVLTQLLEVYPEYQELLFDYRDYKTNFCIIYNIIPKNKRFQALKSLTRSKLMLFETINNEDVLQFIMEQFPARWRTQKQITNILSRSTPIYVAAEIIQGYTETMKNNYECIVKKIDEFYSRSLYQAYTEQYITNFEARINALIEAEYKGVLRPLAYFGRFFARMYCPEITPQNNQEQMVNNTSI